MRLILAIDIPEETEKQLSEQLDSLQKKYPQYNWMSPENFHITIHHFGEVKDPDAIAKRIEDLLFDIESFRMYSHKLDVFVRNQLLLYLGFLRQKTLEKLAERIKEDLGEEHKRYVPHLTLSRSPLSSKQQYFALQNRLAKTPIDIEFEVTKIYLIESASSGRKPVYNKISEFKLL